MTNSVNYGVERKYVLYDNGTFSYQSYPHCTFGETKGVGTYQDLRRKLIFTFDTLHVPISAANCFNTEPSDSIQLFVFDTVDSSEVDFFSIKTDTGQWPGMTDNKIARPEFPFEIIWMNYHSIRIEPDSICSKYEIFLTPNFDTIAPGTERILKKKKGVYKRLVVRKAKDRDKRKYKSVYLYQFKSN